MLNKSIIWMRVIALIAAVASAVFWFQSAATPTAVEMMAGGINMQEFRAYWGELGRALVMQAELNQRAAIAAGISVILQAVASLLATYTSRG
jgi:hypothetical protein